MIERVRQLALQGFTRREAESAISIECGSIGRTFTPAELQEFRAAAGERRAAVLARKSHGPKSTADRVAAHVAERNDVGEIPAPRHPRLKEYCRTNLEAFGWYYCRQLLKHRASDDIKEGLVNPVQNCAINGGQVGDLFARGGGKTTWVCAIAPLWAMLYGHRRFPVAIGASIKASKKILKTVKRLIARSDAILADFPAIAIPVRHLGGVSQRAAAQTYNGEATDIEWGSDQITLPTLRNANGDLLDAGCGAVFAITGIGGAIRGANEGGQRPDMLLIDDPQTKKAARSPKMVQDILEYIHSDALALAGHDTTIAAFLTITPQRFGDVATEISAQSKYPEWQITVQPFIKQLPPNWEGLVSLFCEQYAADAAAKEFHRPRSTAWYLENKHLFSKTTVIDTEQYDHDREVDVVHHLLNLRAKLGKVSFDAEIMMRVVDAASEISINPDRVASSMNGAPRGVCPPGTDTAVAFCDINTQAGAGLSWAIVAFGPRRVAAVVDYGRYPADGSPLAPPNAGKETVQRNVAAGIRAVVDILASRRLRDTRNRAIRLRAVGFDRGWLPDVVHRSLYVIRKRVPLGFPIVAMRGFPWNKFGTRKEDILRRGDHVFATRSKFGEYLAVMSPYWREIMQSGFLETALMPGSISLFGSDPVSHYQFANEICAEKLIRKYQVYSGRDTTTAWDWMTTGPEHWCDAVTGCFALASWFRAFDAATSTVDAAALGVKLPSPPSVPRQDDLFNPMLNSAVTDYNGAADETEGTCDTSTPRHKSEKDYEAAYDSMPDDVISIEQPAPLPVRKMRRPPSRKFHPFKKGRWCT